MRFFSRALISCLRFLVPKASPRALRACMFLRRAGVGVSDVGLRDLTVRVMRIMGACWNDMVLVRLLTTPTRYLDVGFIEIVKLVFSFQLGSF